MRHNEYFWRYGFNLQPTIFYRLNMPELTGVEAKVLGELNENGYAKTTVAGLFEDDLSLYTALLSAVENLNRQRAEDLNEARKSAKSEGFQEGKSFQISLLGAKPIFEPDNIFARFALQKSFLKIADAYLGMQAKLKYFNIWHNFASKNPAKSSQLWHRDRDDIYILKIFVYLSDVDDSAGPFTYALKTHPKGRNKINPDFFIEGGVARTTDAQMKKALPKDFWEKATGKKGTIVFADTRGFHKGGLAREHDRLLYTCMFTSPASQVGDLMTVSPDRTATLPKNLRWLYPN